MTTSTLLHWPKFAGQLALIGLLTVTPQVLPAKSNVVSSPAPKPAPPPTLVDVLLQKFDTEHIGHFDRDAMQAMKKADPTDYAEAIKWDKNHDGILDVTELAAWRASLQGPKAGS
jgi:hypothetical protein